MAPGGHAVGLITGESNESVAIPTKIEKRSVKTETRGTEGGVRSCHMRSIIMLLEMFCEVSVECPKGISHHCQLVKNAFVFPSSECSEAPFQACR